MASKSPPQLLEVAGREVRVTSPDKIYFPQAGITKLDLVHYYLAVGEGALRGIAGRPLVLKRYVKGIEGDFFFQKRAPTKRPSWVQTVELKFPSGRTAHEIVVRDLAQLVWIVNLGCIDLNPHPVRSDDLDHPDELRVDLDPTPGTNWSQIQRVARCVKDVLDEHGLRGWPKTSGSRGIHINVRIEPRWTFTEVRRAALALARAVEQRLPQDATSKWWKEERHGVFLDYNQNAKDRTVASAYSVRPNQAALVSAPLSWDELPQAQLSDFSLANMPARYAEHGDLHAGIDEAAGSLEGLLGLSATHEAQGQGDAPWPPHFRKQEGEPARVQPSRRKAAAKKGRGGRRQSKMPLITIAKAKKKEDAMAGLTRWKERHPEAAKHLTQPDVLVDAMRGRSTTWTRIRLNLRHVPEANRPAPEPPDPDDAPELESPKKP